MSDMGSGVLDGTGGSCVGRGSVGGRTLDPDEIVLGDVADSSLANALVWFEPSNAARV